MPRIGPLLGASFLLLLAACSDLGAIQSISSKLTDASRSWHDVAAEFRLSCERTRQFDALLGDCDSQAAAGRSIGATDALLTAYFQALADASNDQNFTIASSVQALGASAAQVPSVDAEEVQAAVKLTSLLARLATEAARERTLRDLISNGGPLARELVRALDHAVPPALAVSLAAERDRVSFQFALYIQQNGGRLDADPAAMCVAGPLASKFSGATFLLAVEYCRRMSLIDSKVAALNKYRGSLADTDQALRDLDLAKTRLKAKALARKLYTTGKELDADVNAVRKAFS